MKKVVLINEMVLLQHAVEIEVESDDDFEQLLEDLDNERCDSADDAFTMLQTMQNITVLNINQEYSVDVDNIEYDYKDSIDN